MKLWKRLKTLKKDIVWSKNVIYQRCQPFSKFHFPAYTTLAICFCLFFQVWTGFSFLWKIQFEINSHEICIIPSSWNYVTKFGAADVISRYNAVLRRVLYYTCGASNSRHYLWPHVLNHVHSGLLLTSLTHSNICNFGNGTTFCNY